MTPPCWTGIKISVSQQIVIIINLNRMIGNEIRLRMLKIKYECEKRTSVLHLWTLQSSISSASSLAPLDLQISAAVENYVTLVRLVSGDETSNITIFSNEHKFSICSNVFHFLHTNLCHLITFFDQLLATYDETKLPAPQSCHFQSIVDLLIGCRWKNQSKL